MGDKPNIDEYGPAANYSIEESKEYKNLQDRVRFLQEEAEDLRSKNKQLEIQLEFLLSKQTGVGAITSKSNELSNREDGVPLIDGSPQSKYETEKPDRRNFAMETDFEATAKNAMTGGSRVMKFNMARIYFMSICAGLGSFYFG
jgi:hypothetical protein